MYISTFLGNESEKDKIIIGYGMNCISFYNHLYGGVDLDKTGNVIEFIPKLLKQLTPREIMVIKKRFGLYKTKPTPLTLQDVADGLGVTRERVRQIEAKALRKLRHPIRSKECKMFLELTR